MINFAVTITKQFTIRIIPLCKHLERVFGLAFLFYGVRKIPGSVFGVIPGMEILLCRSGLKNQHECDGREGCAGDRAEDRDPAVGPAAVTLGTLHREDGVGDSRGEVSGWVDRIAGRSAQGHSDGHDQHGDREGSDCAEADVSRVAWSGKHQDAEHQKPCSDELAEEVPAGIVDRWHRAECPEFCVRILGRVIVILVECPHEGGSEKSAEHLGYDVAGNQCPGERTGHCETDRDGRVEVSP